MNERPITVKEVLTLSTRYLAERGSPSARLDTEILTAMAMGVRRLDLYLAPQRPLSSTERESLRGLIRRRGLGEPVAYITGRREFHGLDFLVTPAVLIPRPETEVLVDAVVEWLAGRGNGDALIADVGTGSGAICCSVARRDSSVRVIGTDTSEDALCVAARNVERLGVGDRVGLVRCDLLAGIGAENRLDCIVSNPPYIGENEAGMLDRGVREYEPPEALFAGKDGMSVTRRLVGQASWLLKRDGMLFIEVGTPGQRDKVGALLGAHDAFDEARPLLDVAGVVRGFVAGRR
ncbi:MAG: peptide chain release factor N(5)-glutamine methyltransferase [Deltaproteobacteria bacterium]|nr:peptide chain release factor N(5)-glutamine methyltransferase [Deltaproteobacteria bacterium]